MENLVAAKDVIFKMRFLALYLDFSKSVHSPTSITDRLNLSSADIIVSNKFLKQ